MLSFRQRTLIARLENQWGDAEDASLVAQSDFADFGLSRFFEASADTTLARWFPTRLSSQIWTKGLSKLLNPAAKVVLAEPALHVRSMRLVKRKRIFYCPHRVRRFTKWLVGATSFRQRLL